MLSVTVADVALLEALAQFRLLTIAQAERRGIARRWHAGERLNALERAGLVGVIRRGRMRGPNVYTLTRKGAAALEGWAEETGEARRVPYPSRPYRDGPHLTQRLCIVDLHLALLAWADAVGATVQWVRVEFDGNPVALQAPTAVDGAAGTYTPDMLAAVTTPDGETWLFAVEVETGGPGHRLDNFRAHLAERVSFLNGDHIEDGTGWPEDGRAARLLFVFETPEMLNAAGRMVGSPTGEEWQRVFFNSLEEASKDFASGWWQVDGNQHSLFRPIGAS